MSNTTDKPAEFTSDEQREAHIAALEVELAYLERSAEGEASLGRAENAKRRTARADEARGQLERLSGKAAEKRPRGAAKETR